MNEKIIKMKEGKKRMKIKREKKINNLRKKNDIFSSNMIGYFNNFFLFYFKIQKLSKKNKNQN